MKKLMVGVAVALALVTSNAAADGVDRRYSPTIAAPVPYVAPSWTGLYIGAGIGAGAVVHDFSIRDDLGSVFNADGIGGDGVLGTAIIGWDWQVGASSVLGVFVDYDFSNINSDHSVFNGAVSAGIDHDHTWSVGARLGFLSNPSTLWYATAGYTEARFEGSIGDDLGTIFSRNKTIGGYFVGAGVDTRLATTNWFLRLEYRFSDFDEERIFRDDSVRVDLDPTMHTARLTLAYKFGSGAYGYGFAPGGWGR